jgi:hypothetical protein
MSLHRREREVTMDWTSLKWWQKSIVTVEIVWEYIKPLFRWRER